MITTTNTRIDIHNNLRNDSTGAGTATRAPSAALTVRHAALSAAALIAMAGGCSDDAEPMSQADVVITVLEQGLVGGDRDVIERYVREDYIQHSAMAADGRGGLLDAIVALDGIDVEIHRVLSDGDRVATHSTYTLADGSQLVAFDIFRLQDGQLAEHWDALQPLVAAGDTASGRSMVDGPTTVDSTADTEASRALVSGFVDRVLTRGEFGALTEFLSTETYDQHNPHVADGLDGLGDFVASLAENGISFGYTQRHLVVAEGNFVLIAAEGYFGPGEAPPYAVFYDLFRVADGKIVEHWDVLPVDPDPAALPHDNGLF